MAMNYRQAQALKNKSTFALMRERFAEGQSLTSSFKTARRLKKQARWVRIKEKFDPMRWSRKLFGKWGATLYGRAMGRNAEDMHHFTGYRPHSPRRSANLAQASRNPNITQVPKNPNVNPLYTKVGAGTITPLRKNDSIADVVAKLYNFVKKTRDKELKRNELSHNFQKEREDNSDKRHTELIEIIKSTYTRVRDAEEPEEAEEGTGKKSIAEWLLSVGGTILGIITTLGSTIVSVLASLAGVLATLSLSIIKTLTHFLLEVSYHLVRHIAPKIIGLLGDVLWWTVKKIAPMIGPLLGPLAVGAIGLYVTNWLNDKWIATFGDMETVHLMNQLDKKGVIDTNIFDKNQIKSLSGIKSLPKKDLKMLIDSGKFEKTESDTLKAIYADMPSKIVDNKEVYPTPAQNDSAMWGYKNETGFEPLKDASGEVMRFDSEMGQITLRNPNVGDQDELPIMQEPLKIPEQQTQNKNSNLQSATDYYIDSNVGYAVNPTQQSVMYNNTSSQSVLQSSSSTETFGALTTRNTDDTFTRIVGDGWKLKNGT